MNVAETGSDGEVGADGLQGLDDRQNVLRLSVQRVVVNVLVVDTILLTTGDTDLHLEPLLHGGSALQVGSGGVDVVVDGLFGQVDHVGGEQGLAMLLEVLLISVEHTVKPWQKLLGAVVGVEDDGDVVCGSDGADVVGSGNGASDGSGLVAVGDALAGKVGSTALRGLQNDGRLGVAGSLKRGDDSRAGGHVDGGDGELVLAGVLEQSEDIIANDDTGLAGQNVLDTHIVVVDCK